MWKGNKATIISARERARRLIPFLPNGYEIHHIDGNVYNNDPTNLLMVTRREHMDIDGRLEWVRHHGYKWKKGQSGNPKGGHPANGLYPQSYIQCKNCVNIEKVDDSYICMDDGTQNSMGKGYRHIGFGYYGKNPERKRHCDYYQPSN